jgi:peroxiredoxin
MNFGKIALKSFVLSLSAVFFAAAAFVSFQAPALAQATGVLTGNAAPDFELKDLNGTGVKLSGYKGKKPVLIYFWATWCPYCMAVRPDVVKLRNDIPKAKMELLAVNVGGADSLNRVKKFDEAHPAPYTILYDADARVPRAYRVQGIPLFIFVDKSGTIKYRGNGLPPDIRQFLK